MINTNVLKLFKVGKLQDFLVLKEINDNIKSSIPVAVEFGTVPNATISKSFLVSFLPVKTTSSKMIIYFDKEGLKALSDENINHLIQFVANYIPVARREYFDFLTFKNNAEIPMSEYLKTIIELNNNFILKLLNTQYSKEYEERIDLDDFEKVISAINNDDLIKDIIEDIKQTNVLPSDTLAYIRKFLAIADVNSDVNVAQMDKYFNKLISVTTSKKNPFWSKEIPESIVGSDY